MPHGVEKFSQSGAVCEKKAMWSLARRGVADFGSPNTDSLFAFVLFCGLFSGFHPFNRSSILFIVLRGKYVSTPMLCVIAYALCSTTESDCIQIPPLVSTVQRRRSILSTEVLPPAMFQSSCQVIDKTRAKWVWEMSVDEFAAPP